MRIKVQLPSVWQTDVYLAENYNPFKANKSTIMLFQHEVSQAGADAGSLPVIACQLMRGRLSSSPHNSRRLSWSEVRPGITSITHPLWTLHAFIWWLIYLRPAGICFMAVTQVFLARLRRIPCACFSDSLQLAWDQNGVTFWSFKKEKLMKRTSFNLQPTEK